MAVGWVQVWSLRFSTLTCLVTACVLSHLTNPIILYNIKSKGSLIIRFGRPS